MKYMIFDRGRGAKGRFISEMKRAEKVGKAHRLAVGLGKTQPEKSIPKSARTVDNQ
jgi:hypothetical protein